MTFTQLEYIVAVNTHRQFAAAAESCFVTQPTLSMQIQKLEEEIGIKIFDRSKQPVVPTESGVEIIEQARKILQEKYDLEELIASRKGFVNGELKVGIIPTLAPYLLPLFLQDFTSKYENVKLQITELTTERIIKQLKDGKIDAAILATPLHDSSLKEDVLFHEKLIAYVSINSELFNKKIIHSEDIDANKIWLLEEGHCFRNQILNLCDIKKRSNKVNHFEYEAGSIETLRRLVDLGDGITIIPELATYGLSSDRRSQLKNFPEPSPVREISIVTHRDFVKRRLVNALKQTILDNLPKGIQQKEATNKVLSIKN